MMPLSLSTIARAVNGRLIGNDLVVGTLVTDTRKLEANASVPALFIAIKGENFDGNDYVAKAAELGARAALVSRQSDAAIPQIVVADTERALADLALVVQRDRRTKVVAITGSNGKTSVKTLTQAIFERAGSTYATPGNRNNEIGMPLAVLDTPEDAAFAIYEMGTGKPVWRNAGSLAISFIDRIGPHGMSSWLRMSMASNLSLVIVHCSMRRKMPRSPSTRWARASRAISHISPGSHLLISRW